MNARVDLKPQFERWYPHLSRFAAAKRAQAPPIRIDDLSPIDRATLRILEPTIPGALRVPCDDDHTAVVFTAPLHVLPAVMREWPSTYKHGVFLTEDELDEWVQSDGYAEGVDDDWWHVAQFWGAEVNPEPNTGWLKGKAIQVPEGFTPVLITWGYFTPGPAVVWAELWGVDATGKPKFLKNVGYDAERRERLTEHA